MLTSLGAKVAAAPGLVSRAVTNCCARVAVCARRLGAGWAAGAFPTKVRRVLAALRAIAAAIATGIVGTVTGQVMAIGGENAVRAVAAGSGVTDTGFGIPVIGSTGIARVGRARAMEKRKGLIVGMCILGVIT